MKFLAKFSLTALALNLVFKRIDVPQFWQTLSDFSFSSFILASILYNVSQWISAKRLYFFLQVRKIDLSPTENLLLYYKSMFYNLLLPGGVGGDGFKLLYLMRNSSGSLKQISWMIILDRLTGGIALLFLSSIFLAALTYSVQQLTASLVFLLCGILIYPITHRLWNLYVGFYASVFKNVSFYGLAVQAVQLLSAFLLFWGLGITGNFSLYLAFFLLSSVFTFIPITIGGVGARELVFVLAAQYAPINQEKAVAFSLLFFLLSALSSLVGAFLVVRDKKTTTPK